MQEDLNSIQKAARRAGFLFIWLIITGLTGVMITSFIEGSGSFIEKAGRIAASQHLYRFGLFVALVETMSAFVLGFNLYIALKPFNQSLAQQAMYWRLGESFIGGVGLIFAFAKSDIYVTAANTPAFDHLQSIAAFAKSAGFAFYNISATFFGIGSVLFFYIFYKSKSIPKYLSVIGLVASLIVPIICIGSLLWPEYKNIFIYGWIPMAVAEIGTGVWLMRNGVIRPPSVVSPQPTPEPRF